MGEGGQGGRCEAGISCLRAERRNGGAVHICRMARLATARQVVGGNVTVPRLDGLCLLGRLSATQAFRFANGPPSERAHVRYGSLVVVSRRPLSARRGLSVRPFSKCRAGH